MEPFLLDSQKALTFVTHSSNLVNFASTYAVLPKSKFTMLLTFFFKVQVIGKDALILAILYYSLAKGEEGPYLESLATRRLLFGYLRLISNA